MLKNSFFKNKGPISLNLIFSTCELVSNKKNNNIFISDVKNLNESSNKDLTFFHSNKYKNQAERTKAKCCLTTKNLSKYLPNSCKPIVVNNVLLYLSQVQLYNEWHL